MFLKGFIASQNHVLCANFVQIGWPEIGKVVRCLPDKKQTSARSPALASVRIATKICQGQLQTIYSEFPKFHPNPFTSGRVIAERVNIVEMRHKVFPILGEDSTKLLRRVTNGAVQHLLKEFYHGFIVRWAAARTILQTVINRLHVCLGLLATYSKLSYRR